MDDSSRLPPTMRAGSTGAALLRWLPVLCVALILAAGYGIGLHRHLSLDALRQSHAELSDLVARNPAAAAGLYVLAYAGAVAVSFPGASILTAAGGLMFGTVAGGVLALAAATAGATLLFLIARTAFGEALARRAGPRMRRLRRGFQEEGFSYLLFLRLVPLAPFWLVNLAAALFGMRLVPFIAATAIGIVPGTFALSFFGSGLASAIDAEAPAFGFLTAAFAVMGLLALAPALLRRHRARRLHDRIPVMPTGGRAPDA